MKKMENIQKKPMVVPENLPSQLRALDSPQQLYAPLFLASYCSSTHTLSLKTPRKTPLLLCFPKKTPPLFPSPFFPPFSRICLPNDLCCSHLFCHLFLSRLPAAAFSATFSTATFICPTPSATSKGEVDSLWPLRMRHVARWDGDTWLKMWYVKTNREKVTHA